MQTGTFEDSLTLSDDSELDVTVRWEGSYQPAKLSGPWEDCYPEEGEIDLDVQVTGDWPEGLTEQEFNDMVNREWDRLEEKAWQHLHDQRDGGREE